MVIVEVSTDILKATKIRIYPTIEQAADLSRQFGAVRFVYNKGLAIIGHRYQHRGQSLNAKHDIKKLLPIAKRSGKYAWLKEADSMALQQACIHLDTAFQRFFDPKDKARYPRFKSRRGKQSSYHCVGVAVGDDWIKIPKIGRIRAKVHRAVPGALKSITLSRTVTGKHYASVLVDTGEPAPAPLKVVDASRVVGLDMGLAHLVTASQGDKTDNPRILNRAQANLRRKQKALSRCQRGSRRRSKARRRVAVAHERVTQARKDFQHKLSRQIVDDNQAVIVETLNIKDMVKNAQLAKHISDAGWHSLVTKLAYKARECGKRLVKIDPWFASSKTCHRCQHKAETLPLKIRSWQCPACATHHDRDINAAINIKQQGVVVLKTEGLSVSAQGGSRNSGTSPVAA